jgi:DNA-binding PadR family transcriptional regulator
MTNAELAILSLIVEQPRHGYQIDQVIQHRGMRDWTEVGFSSIYYLLKKLEREGFIEGRLQEAERGPARKVYTATSAGDAALEAGVLEALSTPHRCYPPLQLGLANLPAILPAKAVAALRRYRDALIARRDHVRERWHSQRPLPYFVDAMFHHSITLIDAEITWVEDFIVRMEAEHDQD